MDESANKGLESKGGDAQIQNFSISRIAVEGYDTSHSREDVEEALRKHFASRGIKLIHAFAPEIDYDRTILCRYGLIYVNEEDESEALKLDGSDMGGRILQVTAYPFDNNRLEHAFFPTKAQDHYIQRTLEVTGFDTSLARDDLKEMVHRVFARSGCSVVGDGCVFVYLHGRDAIEKALKLSGGSVGGLNILVNEVLPLEDLGGGGGVSLASMLAMAEIDEASWLAMAMAKKDKANLCEGNQMAIMTTD